MEDRPYRSGMTEDKAIKLLQNMADGQALDPDIVDLLVYNFNDFNASRIEAQSEPSMEYGNLFLEVSNS